MCIRMVNTGKISHPGVAHSEGSTVKSMPALPDSWDSHPRGEGSVCVHKHSYADILELYL